ncbi:MAG TPA: ferritin-like domain-containing protein [Mycobacterium sp.]|nr:ferritin-like domain-containing protein [Mycobacterium sp.]
MTSAETAAAAGPDGALCDALATEYGVIYGYGIVSAHVPPDLNKTVSDAIHEHRERRDRVITMLAARSVNAPVAAAGYQPPIPVDNDTDAAQLAVRMEDDTAVAWRAVAEQADTDADREFAVQALSQSAVLAARWNRVLGRWPITRAFPGGDD